MRVVIVDQCHYTIVRGGALGHYETIVYDRPLCVKSGETVVHDIATQTAKVVRWEEDPTS